MTIFEIIGFIAQVMGMIFNALDNVYLGEHSILDIQVSILYLNITFWGIFTLLDIHKHKKESD